MSQLSDIFCTIYLVAAVKVLHSFLPRISVLTVFYLMVVYTDSVLYFSKVRGLTGDRVH